MSGERRHPENEPMHPLDDLIDAGAYDEQPEPDDYVPLDLSYDDEAVADLAAIHAGTFVPVRSFDPTQQALT